MHRLMIFTIILIALGACGHRATVERDYDDQDESYSQSVGFSSETDFEQSRRLVRERDFDGAISTLREIYRHGTNDENRARALLEWAKAEGHLLNPNRDLGAAIARLELLGQEFTESEVAFEASEELERMRGWLEDEK